MKNITIKKLSKKKQNTLKNLKLKTKNLKTNNNISYNSKNNLMDGGTKEIDYREEFIEILKQLEFYNRVYEKQKFKAKRYREAVDQLKNLNDKLSSPNDIKNLPGIGKAITEKLDEFIKTNKVKNLEQLKEKYKKEYQQDKIKQEQIAVFTQIPWIGETKAEKLLELEIYTIEELKKRKDEKIPGKGKNKLALLNSAQLKGLEYYEQTLERIPRPEIDEYKELFTKIFLETLEDNNKNPENNKFEIVGSYRRGALNSGDIDLYITSKENDKTVFNKFLDKLDDTKEDKAKEDKANRANKVIKAFLTKGEKKVMVIGKLNDKSIARRIDFLYAPPDEYAFAVLYFTGSKDFNTAMRQHALNNNLTLNEHGLHKIKDKVKGEKITNPIFNTEKDIFDYLNLEFKEPHERIDGNSIVIKSGSSNIKQPKDEPKKESECKRNCKTLKTKKETDKTKTLKTKKDQQIAIKNIEKFKSEGISVFKSLSEDELTDMLKEAIDKYYGEKEESIFTDEEYDILREYVLKKYPKNKTAKDQHINLNVDKNKVKLPYEMWSMDKIKPDTKALDKFKNKFTGPYVISCKLDGISALYSTEENQSAYGAVSPSRHLYTRGNGTYGESIDHLIPYLNLPTEKNITIRGELIIKEKVFQEKYSKTYKNSRNFITGIKNTKTLTQKEIDKIKDLDFVAYEVIKPENLKPSEQFNKLIELETITVEHSPNIINEQLTNQYLSEQLIKWREEYEYAIDGIICIDDKIYPRENKNPEHAFAFKMVLSDQVVEAKVIDIIWTPSKDGYLKPRVQIEPVTVAGATINYATGFNAKFIKDYKIGVGAIIRLIRSGDVIPHIEEVITPASVPLMPKEEYYWNETNVDIILTSKENDKTVLIKNLTGFFKALEVEGLKEANIKKIVEIGGNTIPKILKMSIIDFEEAENFKKKMATKIYNSIQKQIGKASLAELAAASNIFGRGFGEKRIQIILTAEPTILTNPEPTEEKIKKVKEIDGLALKTATQFVKAIPKFIKFLEETNLQHKLSKDKDADKDKDPDKNHPLNSKVIVMSDFKSKTMTKKDLTAKLVKLGAKVETNLTSKTDILIVGDITKETGKIKKAKEQPQTQIVELEEFLNDHSL